MAKKDEQELKQLSSLKEINFSEDASSTTIQTTDSHLSVNEARLRPNVCILLLNKEGDIFIAERSDEADHWQFPQGGIEDEGDLEDNAFRELAEETGILRSSCQSIGPLSYVNKYTWPIERRLSSLGWDGQSQRFFVAIFLGDDSEIKLDNHHQVEFSSWRWCPILDVMNELAPIRREGCREAIRELVEINKKTANTP